VGGFRAGVVIGGLAAAVVGLAIALILTAGSEDAAEPIVRVQTETRTVTEAPLSPNRPKVTQFRSPSANILCRVTIRDATCGIKEFRYSPPPQPPDCDLPGWGHTLAVGTVGNGSFLCSGQAPASPTSRVLRYGHVLRLGPFECGSSALGMLCENWQTERGFVISRERYRVY